MWFQNHKIRLETNDKHKGWNSPVKLHFHVCLSWAPSEVRQLVSDSQCKYFRIAALNHEHALCTWMWIIISKLAYVVLCLHFTLTHFFCLTTPLSDRWVSIYESLSQPSLNSLPLAYHFDLYQLTLFCFPCFICISLWREKQREWGCMVSNTDWVIVVDWPPVPLKQKHDDFYTWPAVTMTCFEVEERRKEERLGRRVEEKKWSKMESREE